MGGKFYEQVGALAKRSANSIFSGDSLFGKTSRLREEKVTDNGVFIRGGLELLHGLIPTLEALKKAWTEEGELLAYAVHKAICDSPTPNGMGPLQAKEFMMYTGLVNDRARDAFRQFTSSGEHAQHGCATILGFSKRSAGASLCQQKQWHCHFELLRRMVATEAPAAVWLEAARVRLQKQSEAAKAAGSWINGMTTLEQALQPIDVEILSCWFLSWLAWMQTPSKTNLLSNWRMVAVRDSLPASLVRDYGTYLQSEKTGLAREVMRLKLWHG